MKKIVYIITRLDKGGSAENVFVTFQRLDPQKYNVTLIYGYTTTPLPETRISLINIPALVRNISPIKDFFALLFLYKYLRKIKPDIVHTHTSKAGILGRWAAKFAGIKNIIHTPHGHIFYGYEFGHLKVRLYIFLEKITAYITKRLIALTFGEKKESLDNGIGKDEQWVIIPSCIDTNLINNLLKHREEFRNKCRAEFGIDSDSILVGTVARFEFVKGVRYLVQSAKIVYDSLSKENDLKKVIFIIIGEGSEEKYLKDITEKFKLKDKIIFAGLRKDIIELMCSMDIYVQPSLNEGMGKTIVQAQTVGLPVIASNVQGIPDVVKNQETGILVQAKNTVQLAENIIKLINDPMQRKYLGENAKSWTNEKVDENFRYSYERMIRLTEDLYEKIL